MEGLGECSGGCVVCVVDTVFEEALVEDCGEEVEGFFGIADHDVDDGFLFADVVQLHVICVEEVFDPAGLESCGEVGECGDNAFFGFSCSLFIGSVLAGCEGEPVKGACSIIVVAFRVVMVVVDPFSCFGEEVIDTTHSVFVFFAGLHTAYHGGDGVEGDVFFVFEEVYPCDEGVEEAFAGFIPEVVFIVFPTCVSDNVFG